MVVLLIIECGECNCWYCVIEGRCVMYIVSCVMICCGSFDYLMWRVYCWYCVTEGRCVVYSVSCVMICGGFSDY